MPSVGLSADENDCSSAAAIDADGQQIEMVKSMSGRERRKSMRSTFNLLRASSSAMTQL